MRTARLAACLVAATLLAALTSGCAARRPVLYPNDTLRLEGTAAGEVAVEQCVALAKTHLGGSRRAGEVAGSTAAGGAVGGAVGAATGAVFDSAGRGAAAGAAGGATRGLIRGLFRRGPDDVTRRFVEQCLRERGYQPIGWR